jgi:exodeoxyribonuclease-3
MQFRIASWNINSVRLRLPLVERFVAQYRPDILCLQETKVRDELFPREAFAAMGFTNLEIRGQAGYHGVATASKLPMSVLPHESFCGTEDARHLGVAVETVPGGARIAVHNLYVPAGGDVPDPGENPKFRQKLDYLRGLTGWCEQGNHSRGLPSIMLGDLNIAPLETDVWSHKQLLKVVSHTPIEVEHLSGVKEGGGWVDVVRSFVPPEKKLYSWWSYRSPNWAAADRGRRLDHIWATPALAPQAKSAIVLKEARGWAQPSDHVPVIVDFELGE